MTADIEELEKNVDYYSATILSHLKGASRQWVMIAHLLRDARGVLRPDEFKKLCETVKLSYSTACKLIKVATDARLANHADRLASVDAWSTLHEITKLNSASFARFENDFLLSSDIQIICRKDVESYRSKTSVGRYVSCFSLLLNSTAALTDADRSLIVDAVSSFEAQLANKIKVKKNLTNFFDPLKALSEAVVQVPKAPKVRQKKLRLPRVRRRRRKLRDDVSFGIDEFLRQLDASNDVTASSQQ